MYKIFVAFFLFSIIDVYAQDYSPDELGWMTHDLNVVKFRNGDTLFWAQTDEEWELTKESVIPSFCYFEGDAKKGVLYNWAAVNDPRGLAPFGYKIPSKDDFVRLSNLNSELKSNMGGWLNYVSIESEFDALAVGYRSYTGSSFESKGSLVYFWTTEKGETNYSYCFRIIDDIEGGKLVQERRESGFTVRCLRNFDETIEPQKLTSSKITIRKNESVDIEVIGGALGKGAEFIWFEDFCGFNKNEMVGSGRKVTLTPSKTTTYYLKTLNAKRNSECFSIEIIVNEGSVLPEEILGNTNVCEGENIELSIKGGELAPNSEWVWYVDYIQGSLPIGKGPTLIHKPEGNSRYFLRSESSNGKKTDFIEIIITVNPNPIKAESIHIEGGDFTCGGNISLKAEGILPSNCEWVWELDSKTYKTGSLYTGYIYVNTNVLLYSQSKECGISKTISKEIIVYRHSLDPKLIKATELNGRKLELNVYDGQLGDGAHWQWYKYDKNGEMKPIKSGLSLQVNSNKAVKYKVRAESGKCEDHTPGTYYSTARKPKQVYGWNKNYVNDNLNSHFGFDIGAVGFFSGDSLRSFDSTMYFPYYGYGLKFGLNFHPIINEFFTLGFHGSFSAQNGELTKSNDFGYNSLNPAIKLRDSYFIYTQEYKTQILIGIAKEGKVKLMIDYGLKYAKNNLRIIDANNSNPFSNNNGLRTETLGIGLRFGSYSSNKNKAKHFDMLYTLSDLSNKNTFDFSSSFITQNFNDLWHWRNGIELNFWLHNVLKIQTGIIFNVSNNNFGNISFSKSIYHFGLVYSFDRFW